MATGVTWHFEWINIIFLSKKEKLINNILIQCPVLIIKVISMDILSFSKKKVWTFCKIEFGSALNSRIQNTIQYDF